MLSFLRFSLILSTVPALCEAAAAADRAPASPPLDRDFVVQGEYVGSLSSGRGCRFQVGLQVIAMGKGRFDAALYRGGLPGAGWNRQTKWKLRGERNSDDVVLSGSPFLITLERPASGAGPPLAIVQHSGGRPRGTLRKIHRTSPTMHAAPPPGATVLFDGRPPENLVGATLTEDGLLKPGATTKQPVGDFRLHMEFRTPYRPEKRGQKRGNSGVYIQRRYEIQILDSFGLEGTANQCGALYRQRPPDLNMCLPPLAWQTYDIWFQAARWDACGHKIAHARITVLHNGVPIHTNVPILSKTGHGQPEGPERLPIHWQKHGNPVHLRNLWIVHYQPPPARTVWRGRLLRRLRAFRPLRPRCW